MEKNATFAFNTFYHVYNRTNGNERLFIESENYRYFLDSFARQILPFAEVWSYCLMPTHYHFLLKIRSEEIIRQTGLFPDKQNKLELDKFFANKFGAFVSGYVHAFNNRFARHGSLFQRPMKRIRVNSNEYLKTVMCYIHMNPVKDGLVRQPESWWHSSYLDYIGSHKTIRIDEMQLPALISSNQIEVVFEQFGGKDSFVESHLSSLESQ